MDMINIFQPDIKAESLDLLSAVFESNWLGRGAKAAEFQSLFATFQGLDESSVHTVSCASDAIFSILSVLRHRGIRGKVIVPTISFPAIGSAVIENGFDLVLCDVSSDTAQICLESLAEIVESTDDICAIFLTHYGGSAVSIEEVREILPIDTLILEDSACALGSFYNDGLAVGTKGDFACWSFDAMKILVCGEGAAVYIKDKELMREFKEFTYLGLPVKQKSGIDSSTENARWWEYQMAVPGIRSVFTDVNAAIGIPQFATLSEKLTRREYVALEYSMTLAKLTNISHIVNSNVLSSSNYFFTVACNNRDELAKFLREKQIYSTFRYFPLNKIELFSAFSIQDFAGTETINQTFLNIPIHNSLSNEHVSRIKNAFEEFDDN